MTKQFELSYYMNFTYADTENMNYNEFTFFSKTIIDQKKAEDGS